MILFGFKEDPNHSQQQNTIYVNAVCTFCMFFCQAIKIVNKIYELKKNQMYFVLMHAKFLEQHPVVLATGFENTAR